MAESEPDRTRRTLDLMAELIRLGNADWISATNDERKKWALRMRAIGEELEELMPPMTDPLK